MRKGLSVLIKTPALLVQGGLVSILSKQKVLVFYLRNFTSEIVLSGKVYGMGLKTK